MLFSDGVELRGGHARDDMSAHGVPCRGNNGADAFQPFNIVLAIDRRNSLRNVGGQSRSFYRIPISRTTPLGFGTPLCSPSGN
jgi:hypothetical protein